MEDNCCQISAPLFLCAICCHVGPRGPITNINRYLQTPLMKLICKYRSVEVQKVSDFGCIPPTQEMIDRANWRGSISNSQRLLKKRP